jgi:hypothetical protein
VKTSRISAAANNATTPDTAPHQINPPASLPSQREARRDRSPSTRGRRGTTTSTTTHTHRSNTTPLVSRHSLPSHNPTTSAGTRPTRARTTPPPPRYQNTMTMIPFPSSRCLCRQSHAHKNPCPAMPPQPPPLP